MIYIIILGFPFQCPSVGGPTLILRHTATRRGASAEVLFTELPRSGFPRNPVSDKRASRKSSFVLCRQNPTQYAWCYTGQTRLGFR